MVGVQHGVGVFARALEAGVGGLGVGGNLPLGVVVSGLGFSVVGGFDEAQLLAGYGCRSGYFASKDADVARAGSTVRAGPSSVSVARAGSTSSPSSAGELGGVSIASIASAASGASRVE